MRHVSPAVPPPLPSPSFFFCIRGCIRSLEISSRPESAGSNDWDRFREKHRIRISTQFYFEYHTDRFAAREYTRKFLKIRSLARIQRPSLPADQRLAPRRRLRTMYEKIRVGRDVANASDVIPSDISPRWDRLAGMYISFRIASLGEYNTDTISLVLRDANVDPPWHQPEIIVIVRSSAARACKCDCGHPGQFALLRRFIEESHSRD